MKKILPEIVSSIRYQVVSNNFVKYKIRNTKYPKKVLAVFLILIIFSGVAMKFWTKEASAAWFDDNYAYRTAITFTNAGAAVTDQKVKFDIDTATLISAGKMQSDCGDSRFTDANGKVLRYYLDTSGGACNGASTDYYVLLPTIPAGSNIVYHYYGNPSVSNGTEAAQFSNTTFTQTPATASEEKAPGPIMYWRFDDVTGTTAQDATNSNLDGTLNNTPVWQKDGCVSQGCLYFGGTTNQNVSKSDDSKLDFAASDSFTVSAWVRRNGASSANNFILTKAQAGYTGYKLYQDASGDYCFDVRDGTNTDSACTSAVDFDDDQWHLVQGVKTGTSTVTLYVDGKQRAQDSSIGATNTLANTGTFYVGVDLDGTSNEWLGFIDDVKVYRYARSATQIQADFTALTNKGGNVLGSNAQKFLSEGLVGHWKMDETSGNASDLSGNSVTLTNNSSTAYTTGKFANAGIFVASSTDYLSTATTISGVKTVAFWVNPSASTDELINLTGSAYLTMSSGTVSATGFTSPSIYVNGVLNGTVIANSWNHIAVVTDTSINANAFEVGRANAAYADGKIDEVRVYNRVFSASEVAALYTWAPGPMADWRFEEGIGTSVADMSGNGSTGTWGGALGNQWTSGKIGKAGRFNGTNNQVTVTDGSVLDLSVGGNYTWSAWVNPSSVDTGECILGSGTASTTDFCFKVITTADANWGPVTNGVAVQWLNSYPTNGLVAHTSDNVISPGRWSYVSVTYDGSLPQASRFRIYVDGIDQTNTSDIHSTGTIASISPSSTFIGNNNNNEYFTGKIDSVRFYNYIRNQKQIIEDMNGGHPAGGSPVGSQVAYWKMNEGYGTTINNSVASTNITGSITGAAWRNEGKFGKALEFDGTDDVVTVTNTSAIDFDTGLASGSAFTAWIYPDNAGEGNGGRIFSKGSNTWLRVDTLSGSTLNIEASLDLETTDATVNVSAPIATGAWNYVVMQYADDSDDEIELYINGKYVGASTNGVGRPTSATLSDTSNLTIGNETGGTTQSFDGKIDEFKIYSSALTASEILIDYNQNASQVLGSAGNKANTSPSAASQEYCTPGDTSCDIPILHWTFEEKIGSVADRSGTGNNGTFANNPTLSLGKYGGGVSFASNQYIAVADNTTFDFGTGSFTLETWAKPNHTDMNSYLISQTNGSTQGFGFRICGSSSCGASGQNLIGFVVGGGGANYRMEYSSEDVVDGNWHHYAVVFDAPNDDVRLYVDGRQLSSTSDNLSTWPNVNNANDFRISGDTTSYLPGSMDETKVFNYARSAAQVAWSYNKGLPVAHWKFDECSGTTAGDSSGNRNTGTWSGSSGTNATVGDCTTNAATARYNGRQGKMNYSLNFDGTDDVVRAAETTSTDLGLTSHSYALAAWIKTSTNFSTDALIIAKDDSGSAPYPYRLYLNSSEQACFDLREGSNTPSICGAIALNDGNWHHIVGIRDVPNDVLRLYVDGKVAATAVNDTTTATTANNDDVSLGNGGTSYTTLDFTGQIDDARIYNYPLTATQVVGVMNGGAVRFAPVTGAP